MSAVDWNPAILFGQPANTLGVKKAGLQEQETATKGAGAFGPGFSTEITPVTGSPHVGGVEGVEHAGGVLKEFKAEKWADGLGGLPTGALGEAGAVYSKLPGGKETRVGGRLNVDAFSVIP